MSTIPPTNQAVGAAANEGASPAAANGNLQQKASSGGLGKDDFLKLMVTQLRHQDPMNPVNDTAFLAQMAQFATLEQITNVGDYSALQLGAQATAQALSLTGKTVTYTDANGKPRTGVVERVVFDKGAATLTIGGVAGISPSAVTEVAETPKTSPEGAAGDSAPNPPAAGDPATVTPKETIR